MRCGELHNASASCSVNPILQEGKTALDHATSNDIKQLLQKNIRKITSKPPAFKLPATSSSPSRVTTGVSALFLGKRKATDSDVATGERSWLGARLRALGVCARWVDHCERTLVQEECLTTEEVFRALSKEEFSVEYLRRVGVTALGLQKHLLALHSELHEQN